MKLSAEQKKVLVDALVYNYKHCANEYDLAMFEKKNVLQILGNREYVLDHIDEIANGELLRTDYDAFHTFATMCREYMASPAGRTENADDVQKIALIIRYSAKKTDAFDEDYYKLTEEQKQIVLRAFEAVSGKLEAMKGRLHYKAMKYYAKMNGTEDLLRRADEIANDAELEREEARAIKGALNRYLKAVNRHNDPTKRGYIGITDEEKEILETMVA